MKCDICEETGLSRDEVNCYNINGDFSDDLERAAANPDNHVRTVCITCESEGLNEKWMHGVISGVGQ